jgi:hypothetical protein
VKFLFIKRLPLWLLLISTINQIYAWENYRDANCNECDLSCFDIQIQAGVAPVIWHKRENFSVVSCNAALGCPGSAQTAVVPLFKMPKFNKLFRVPWTIGGLFGYWISDCDEVYIEGNYRQAKAKSNNFTIAPIIALPLFTLQPQFVFSNLTKYKFYDFFVGLRHYFDLCWCNSSFFIGGQIGLVHHKDINFKLTVSSITNPCNPPFTTGCMRLFEKNTRVAGGANIGFDWDFCNCFSIVLTAEFIATCGPHGAQNLAFPSCTADIILPELRPDAFFVGSIENEFYFPVTLGFKYRF